MGCESIRGVGSYMGAGVQWAQLWGAVLGQEQHALEQALGSKHMVSWLLHPATAIHHTYMPVSPHPSHLHAG